MNFLSMKRLYSTKIFQSVKYIITNSISVKEKPVIVKGWVKNVRILKELVFIDLSDGSTPLRLQVIASKSALKNTPGFGSSIEVSGKITTGPKGSIELIAEKIEVIGDCALDEKYPFRPRKSYSLDYSRQFLHLRHRTNFHSAVLRIRNEMTMGIHNYFQNNGFTNIYTPILTSNDCEGAGELFKVVPDNAQGANEMNKGKTDIDSSYFNNKAFLTVSGQLHLEAICRSIGNVYNFGPCFRAENSKSRLHLSEFSMIEAEIAFCDSIETLINITEDLIKSVYQYVLLKSQHDLKLVHSKNIPDLSWIERPFNILTHKEAVEICQAHSNSLGVVPKLDESLNKEQELFLVKHCKGPVFVIEWPIHLKSFYMKEMEHDQNKVDAFDLLAPMTGEIVGGSVRESSYEKLAHKLPSNKLDWYLDLRKYGNIPTAGFGLGLERLMQLLCNIENIKDTIPFPRWPHNCQL